MKNSYIILLSFTLAMFGCTFNGGHLQDMESAEKAANTRASNELVAYMSLETMFPDSQVRALAKAAGKGDIKKIDQLVDNGVDVNSRGTRNATPLFWAMRNINGFKKLLVLGADPNVVFDDGGNVIRWAVKHDDERFLKEVLQHGGNPNLVSGQFKETPLFAAMGPEGKDKAGILLDAGSNINSQKKFGNTPIMVAAGLGQFDLVYDLLNRKADYTIKNDNGNDLSDIIALREKTMDPNNELTQWMHKVIAWLNERGVDIPRHEE